MPRDIYIYLKGGRGDAFVSNWNGNDPTADEEGTLVDGETPADGLGREAAEPYRDIFQQGGQVIQVAKAFEDPGPGDYLGSVTKDYTLPAGSAWYPTALKATTLIINAGDFVALTPQNEDESYAVETTTSDDLAHTPPRQYAKVCTWLVFEAEDTVGEETTTYKYKFRKSEVIGWGDQRRDA